MSSQPVDKRPTQRFSSRVQDYVNYRPRYPQAVISTLEHACGLTADHLIADVGSGTGFLSEVFLRNGNSVIGIEPNLEMREAGEAYLANYPYFSSSDATAEFTRLPSASVDFVVVGQAWHWFKGPVAAREFKRILRPGGWIVLAWNARRLETTAFLREYERVLCEFCPEYGVLNHQDQDQRTLSDAIGLPIHTANIPNSQLFDRAGFLGRVFSSSYTPEPGTSGYVPMRTALIALFHQHAVDDLVSFEYDCMMYFAQAGKI